MHKGRCALCLKENQDLQRSHFLGKAFYRLNREGGKAIMATPELIIPTDRQLWAHLLCSDCEQRISRNGEDAAMRLVQRKDSFSLLDRLGFSWPEANNGTTRVYSGALAGIETDKLAYFALSVIWRSAVRKWKTLRQQTSGISLGSDEEPIRAYLAGETGFPPNVAVLLTVCTDIGSRNMVVAPWRSYAREYPSFFLLTRGIWFRAFVHPQLPPAIRNLCCVNGPRNPLFVEDCEHELSRLVESIDKSAAVAPSLQTLLADAAC
jgi:hypothetical protein